MKSGERLVDAKGQQTPYQIEGLIGSGARYQIAAAQADPAGEKVALRAINYDEKDEAQGRREQLRKEWEFLSQVGENSVLPRVIEWLEVAESPLDEASEPLLVMERVDGVELYQWIIENHPGGLEPERVLEMISDLTQMLAIAHREKWLWRDFDPRRFVVTTEGKLRAISLGGVVKTGAALGEAQRSVNDTYVAPEIRDEITGSMQRPAADLYGVGALMSFMVTGEEPRERVESPLSFSAFERLQSWELPGLELLIARLLQPLAKNRIGRAERLQPFLLSVDSLPEREDKGFRMTMLPAPWLGLEMENPAQNRSLRSSLSVGPLVSIERKEEGALKGVAEESDTAKAPPARAVNWPLIVGLVLFVVAALLFAIFSGS